jgi:hypothetical protein
MISHVYCIINQRISDEIAYIFLFYSVIRGIRGQPLFMLKHRNCRTPKRNKAFGEYYEAAAIYRKIYAKTPAKKRGLERLYRFSVWANVMDNQQHAKGNKRLSKRFALQLSRQYRFPACSTDGA